MLYLNRYLHILADSNLGGALMDIFVEQIVKRRFGAKDYAIMVGISFLAAVVVFLSVMILSGYVGGIAFLVAIGALYGAFRLIMARNLEFEYSATNGDLTVDKIINRQRRKRVVSFDVKNAEEMGKYNAAKLQHRNFDNRYFVGEYEDGRDCWYITCRSQKTGHILVVFNPEERVLEAIKPFLQRQVRIDAFGRG